MAATGTRHISTDWDRLRCPIEITNGAGIGLTGLTVTLTIRRRSDGQWWNSTSNLWQGTPFGITVPPVDAVNLPGYYEFLVNVVGLDKTAGRDGYVLKFNENSQNILEYVDVTVRDTRESINEEIWTADLETLGFIGAGNQTTSSNLLWLLIRATMKSWTGTTPATMLYKADAAGTGGKLYHAAGPTSAQSALYAGALGLYKPTGENAARLVRVTGLANDGDECFVLAEMDGSAVTPTAINDELIVAQANDFAVQELMNESMSTTASLGSFKDLLKRMLGLRQSNMRLVQTAWNAAGAVTAGYVLIYDSASDANSDSSPYPLAVGRYDFTAAYDGSLRMTEYVSVRTS